MRDRNTGFSGNEEGRSQGPEWQGEGRGLNRDQYICLVMYSRVNTLRMTESPLLLHVLPKTLKASRKLCESERDRDVIAVLNTIWCCRQTGDWDYQQECAFLRVCVCVKADAEDKADKQQPLPYNSSLSAGLTLTRPGTLTGYWLSWHFFTLLSIRADSQAERR